MSWRSNWQDNALAEPLPRLLKGERIKRRIYTDRGSPVAGALADLDLTH